MGWRLRKTIRLGKNYRINLSKSGMSTSTKLGPVTLNSRRGTTIRVAKGLSYHVDQGSRRKVSDQSAQQLGLATKHGCCLFTTLKWFVITVVVIFIVAVIIQAR